MSLSDFISSFLNSRRLMQQWSVDSKLDLSMQFLCQPSSPTMTNRHHLPTTLPISTVFPAHTLSSPPNRTLPLRSGTCSFHGSSTLPMPSSSTSPLNAVDSASTSLCPLSFAVSTAAARERDKPCAECSAVERWRLARPHTASIGYCDPGLVRVEAVDGDVLPDTYVARYARRWGNVGANARLTVLDLAIRWIVGTKRGCRVGWLSSVEGSLLGSAVGSSGWVRLIQAWSSWRKASRLEQMMRAVGDV